MMTEQEAKERWCPFARVLNQKYFPAHNRIVSSMGSEMNPRTSRCIGSACMAWRWVRTDRSTADRIDIDLTRGYCGLAGNP